MSYVWGRRLGVLSVCLLIGQACSCGDEKLTGTQVPKVEFGLEATGAVSCDGAQVHMSALAWGGDPPYEYRWEPADGLDDATSSTPLATVPLTARDYHVTVVDAKGRTLSRPASVRRVSPPTAVIDVLGATTLCAGDELVLDASPSADAAGNPVTRFAWDLDGSPSTIEGRSAAATFVPLASTTVRLTVTDSNGCTATATRDLSVRELPTAVIDVVGSSVLCEGDEAVVDGSRSVDAGGRAVASYEWELDGTPGTIESTSASSGSFVPVAPVTLGVRDAAGCFARASATVPVAGKRVVYPFGSALASNGTKAMADIILLVDNSASMTEKIAAVQRSLDTDFAQIIQNSGIDYRIILISEYGEAEDNALCIGPPLGGASCSSPPPSPVNTARFFHYDQFIDSQDSLWQLLDSYLSEDPHRLTRTGWSAWLRPGAKRIVLEITDDETSLGAAEFEQRLFALTRGTFGSAASRNYVWYNILGLAQNTPATAPWEPTAPIVSTTCTGLVIPAPGIEYQKLSIWTGGLRFPICEYASFGNIFSRIARSIVGHVNPSCAWEMPATPDRSSLAVEYTPATGDGAVTLTRVADEASCMPDAFYLDAAGILRLCPSTCTEVLSDGGTLALTGCTAP